VLRRTRITTGRRRRLLLPLLVLTGSTLALAAPGIAVAQPARATDSGRPRTVVVLDGDTLEQISLRHGVSLSALIEANGLPDPRRLQVGQVLRLPPPGAVAIIRPGDTLEALAARHGLSLGQLQAANPSLVPEHLPVGGWVRLNRSAAAPTAPPERSISSSGTAEPPSRRVLSAAPAPPLDQLSEQASAAEAALLLSSAERRDRAALALREASGQIQWKRYGNTLIDWNGWRLHPGGVRITLVKASPGDLGPRLGIATSMAVHCGTLRQTWRVDGAWEPWSAPQPRSVAQRIVLDLCSNTLDGPAVPIPDAPTP
jgi:murein DD-endopeptidase MepM/ murein hydrolase activator NlpD